MSQWKKNFQQSNGHVRVRFHFVNKQDGVGEVDSHVVFSTTKKINFTWKYVEIITKTGTVYTLNIYLLKESVRIVTFWKKSVFCDDFIHQC